MSYKRYGCPLFINLQLNTMKPNSHFTTALLAAGFSFFMSCSNEQKPKEETSPATTETPAAQSEVHGTEIKAGDVELTNPLNQQWVTNGKGIYEMKCQSCHKLTEERLVGPGWKGVTQRREPHWIMNMITNVDMMLEKDAEAQKLLEQCLVRMPNQNISKDDSRQILEFMRSNDGAK